MTLEALLAYGHIVSLLMAATFLASQTALCRSEWLNAAAVERLVRLDRLWWLSALAVLLTGLARNEWIAFGGCVAVGSVLYLLARRRPQL